MRSTCRPANLGAFLAVVVTFLGAFPAAGQQTHASTQLLRFVHHDVSPPLRDLPPIPEKAEQRVIPLRLIHRGVPPLLTDAVLQSSSVGPAVATSSGLNFAGVGQGAYNFTVHAAPPDTNGSVGATQYVQWVNLSFAVFDKGTGGLLYGPAAGNTLWKGFGVAACANNNDGDPIAQYDKAANRWVMTQLSFTGGPPYYFCIAVSTTSDATGSYNRYALQWTNNTPPDYPKIGVWSDAYYTSFNMFTPFGSGFLFLGAEACALDRNMMLTGGTPNANSSQCFIDSSQASWLPSDLDGSTAPPSGEPAFYLDLGSNSLNLFTFHVDFTNSSNTTFNGPINIPVAAFSDACGGGTCIPQAGTSQQLDSIGERLMWRLAYRNFGDHEALVANHSVATGAGNVGVRWYELRNPNGNPTVFQQGTYAPDSNYRWMGSVAMDKAGDMAVGYSVSSSAMNPAIRYTGRVPSDPLGTLQAETSIIEGTGSQLPTLSRWGDYSGMSVDPVDDCTFFYTNEYLLANGTFNWSTRIASFKFPSCGGTPTPDFSISATPSSVSVNAGTNALYTVTVTPSNGYGGTVNLTVSGLPSGATASFNPASMIPPYGSSTLTVVTSTTTPAGSYLLTLTGTDSTGAPVHSTTVTLVVINNNNPVPTLTSLSPSSAVAGSAAFTLTVNGSNFVQGAVVQFNGNNRTTTYVSSTKVKASILASDVTTPGVYPVTVTNPAPGGGTSNTLNFTVKYPAPKITSLSPASTTAGGAAFILTINGSNFFPQSVAKWNGSARTTTFVNSTQLQESITAADIAKGQNAKVSVTNPAPGGGTTSVTFVVNNPVPAITSISPSSTTHGGAAFTLTVTGSNFVPTSVARWNGTNRTTTFVSSTQVTASILASDIASAGTAQVAVFNTTPGGGTSNALTFTIQ
jgi:hypothetical protein